MNSTALIATADGPLRDDLLRLAAAAGASAEVVRQSAAARLGWRRPGLVLVGDDLADDLAGVPHRSDVVLVARAADPDVYRRAVDVGAQKVAVLPADEPVVVDALAASAEPAGAEGVMVCVCGARGGAGTTVLAAALAMTAARDGTPTLLVDADPLGGGLDQMLGVEEDDGVRWAGLTERRGRLSAALLRESLPKVGELSVLTGDPGGAVPEAAASAVLDAALRGYELTVVDVPRRPDLLGLAALRAAAVTFLLVPAEVRPTMAAARWAPALAELTTDLRLVVGLPSPAGLTPDIVAECVALPAAGVLERDQRLAVLVEDGDLERGLRRGPMRALCDYLLSEVPISVPSVQRKAA
ncbi:CobQ/CobB/MinD/ParA nucleotide binding domain protein [Actinomadura rubteroloni]|uniref:CobQ/CobB/MinD/ParA nucleotide binding domain protein n=1 Tax=Actinomadura rubteroloni TaxID=1926885 RepID=A0A2P4UN71_9ACTN|nr:septum site-determining protein Ssd [Actinomadura rubteroloni]POM26485.1 CobQ/CobB/MinD/ParA nucleotide binding domain protein [Actinomadura rubteroloni]